MLYKIVNKKVKFFEIVVDEKINKIRNKIIENNGKIEHKNVITSYVFSPIEKNSIVINFDYKRIGFFLYEYNYDIIYYPEFVMLLDSIINTSDYTRLKELNKYRVPLHIRRLDDSRYKSKLIKRDYPYDKYIKDIKSCFKTKVIEEVEFDDELQLINILLQHNVGSKKQLKNIYDLIKNNNKKYEELVEQLSY